MPFAPPPLPPTAQPRHSAHFDAWNSSSTGHQRAENRLSGSTGWRDSRSAKLAYQFKSGGTGGRRVADTVGAGAEGWDERRKVLIPKELRRRKEQGTVRDMLMRGPSTGDGERAEAEKDAGRTTPRDTTSNPFIPSEDLTTARRKSEDAAAAQQREHDSRTKGIFTGLTIYINGSTAPLISDHRLKQTLAENGARVSISLGRRAVTHVVVGRPCSGGTDGALGAGGGLAGGKLQKEIRRV